MNLFFYIMEVIFYAIATCVVGGFVCVGSYAFLLWKQEKEWENDRHQS